MRINMSFLISELVGSQKLDRLFLGLLCCGSDLLLMISTNDNAEAP